MLARCLDSLAELVRGFLMIGGFCAWEPTTAMHSMPHQPRQQAESKCAGTHTNKTVALAVATLTDTRLLLKIAHCARPYLMLAVATPHVYARGHQARAVEHMLRRHTSSILVNKPQARAAHSKSTAADKTVQATHHGYMCTWKEHAGSWS
jgi:hypothetical protein